MTDNSISPTTDQPAPKKRSGLTLGIAFAAVAALAATVGVVGARSIGGGGGEPATAGGSSTQSIVPVADIAYGEARGLDDVHQEENLVSTDWLEENLDDPSIVVVEVSEGRDADSDPLGAYDQGHVPGAIGAVWYRDFVQHLTRDLATPEAGSWVAEEPNADIRAFQPELLQVVNGEIPGQIVDIRGVPEFEGEIGVAEGFGGEAAAKWGHIPGAVNSPWGQIVNQPDDGGDGTFLDVEDIRAHYADLGIDGSEPIYVYCRIGERASHTWFALSQLLGYDVKLYDGSWTEWGNSVGVPVENPTLEASGEFSGLWGGN